MFVPYVGRHVSPYTTATKSGKDKELVHIVSVNMATTSPNRRPLTRQEQTSGPNHPRLQECFEAFLPD